MVQRGCSYAKRVKEVNEIYDKYARMGLSNRAIWQQTYLAGLRHFRENIL